MLNPADVVYAQEPPNFVGAVKSLADGIQEFMAALHTLQSTLLRDSPASPMLEYIKNSRPVLSTEWAKEGR